MSMQSVKTLPAAELQCGLCGEQYRQPRVLSCLHTFCLTCLQSLAKSQDREVEIWCPACQQRTPLSSPDLSTLPSNPVVMTLLEVKSVEAGAGTCTSCEGDSSAVCRCLDCAAFLCSNCKGAHSFMKCFKSHRLVKLDMLSVSDLASPVKTSSCPRHNREVLEFYCNTCDTLVCLKCTAVDHPMTSHQYGYIKDAAAVMKTRLVYLMENGRKRSDEVKVQLLQMEEKLSQVEVEKTRVKGEVDKVFHTLLTKLEDRQVEMCQEVETLFHKQEQFLHKQEKSLQLGDERLQAVAKFVDKLFTYGSSSDLLTCGKMVTSQFNLLMKQCPGSDMKSSGSVGVSVDHHAFSSILNKIQIQIKAVQKDGLSGSVCAHQERSGAAPPLQEDFSPNCSQRNLTGNNCGKEYENAEMHVTELQRVATIGRKGNNPNFCNIVGIKVGSNGNIYVLDRSSLSIQVFGEEGKYLFQFGGHGNAPGQMETPVNLAMSEKGYIAIRESTNRIQVFSEKGQFIHQFHLRGLRKPRCMVIDRKGRFLVVDVGTDHTSQGVVIADSDGKLLAKVKCKEISKLSVYSSSLVVSTKNQMLLVDHRAHCVQVYSEDGHHLRTIRPRCQPLSIKGLIFDEHNLILVTSCYINGTLYTDGLVAIAKDGTVLERFRFPGRHLLLDVALTRDGCPLVDIKGSSDIFVYNSIYRK